MFFSKESFIHFKLLQDPSYFILFSFSKSVFEILTRTRFHQTQSNQRPVIPPTVIMLPQLVQNISKPLVKRENAVDKSLARRTRKKRRVLSRTGNDEEAFKMLEAEAKILNYPSGFNTNPRIFLEHILKIKCPGKVMKKVKSQDWLEVLKDTTHLQNKANSHVIGMNVMKALQSDDVDSLKWFLDKGFSVNYHNKFGETLIHHACRMQAVKCINELLERKVIVGVSSISGRNPLHNAIWFKEEISLSILRLLCGICPVLLVCEDWLGHTPLDNVSPLQWPVLCDFLNLSIDHYIKELQKCMVDENQQQKVTSGTSTATSESPKRASVISAKIDGSEEKNNNSDSDGSSKNGAKEGGGDSSSSETKKRRRRSERRRGA